MSQVEIVSGLPNAHPNRTPWLHSRRILVFSYVFFSTLVIGQILNFSRAATYRGSATVLTVAPAAVDVSGVVSDLDLQHVAIQRQLLLGRPLMQKTLERLQSQDQATRYGLEETEDFQSMLSVIPIPSTHLVELSADGPQPELLPLLVNSWIESYLEFREQNILREVGDTLEALDQQYQELGHSLTEKRDALEAFRARHSILTQGRTENQAHARLQGLNQSLTTARDTEVNARARLKSIQAAIKSNEPVVPENEKSDLIKLQTEAEGLRDELKNYENRYNPTYMMVNPRFQELPQRLADLENQIRRTIEEGRKILLTDARQEWLSAIEVVKELERQLKAHESEAADFTARFAEYEAMAEDLKALEELYRETDKRRVQIESKSMEKYPQVRVVDWAYLPTTPLHPHYGRDAVIVFIAALALGVLAVWLVEYLRHPETQAQAGGLTGIRVYSPTPTLEAQTQAPLSMTDSSTAALSAPALRELTAPEIESLWRIADPPGRRLIGLLLTGLTLPEITALAEPDYEPASGQLQIGGKGGRVLTLSPEVNSLFQSNGLPAVSTEPGDLDADIRLLAYDAGLPFPEQVNAETLRHSYIMFLVRQGARLRELERIVGPVPPQTLAAYGPYAPKVAGKPLEDLNLHYPVA